uniref:Uncharacterized protein n=1 Tax=Rhizophora mucronata TaxID=61149 RepID=A0A2P2IP50_RHIMU
MKNACAFLQLLKPLNAVSTTLVFKNGERVFNRGSTGEKGCRVKMEMKSLAIMTLSSEVRTHRFLEKTTKRGLMVSFIELKRFKGFFIGFSNDKSRDCLSSVSQSGHCFR